MSLNMIFFLDSVPKFISIIIDINNRSARRQNNRRTLWKIFEILQHRIAFMHHFDLVYIILYIYLLLHWKIKYPIIVFGQRVGMLFTEFYLFHFCIFIAEHDQLSFADIHGFPDLVVRETLYVLTLSVCLFLANKFKPILIINDVLECSIKTSGKQK